MLIIWSLMKGETSEGGELLGLYFSKQDARPDFERQARKMHLMFGIKAAWQNGDESVTVEAGCDWLTLAPHEVKGDPAVFVRALEAGVKALPR